MKRTHPLQAAKITAANRLMRVAWEVCRVLLYRPTPIPMHAWRRMLLRAFGAKVGKGAHPYPRARIWAPWNLSMDAYSCLANDVDCYCVAPVRLGTHVTVSQYSYLCTASHDFRDPSMPLVAAAITIEDEAWVAADVFVGPGVNIGKGAVVGARSTVIADVEEWKFVAGSPVIERGERPRFTRSSSHSST